MTEADNAVIMAAGASSRFAPLSYEKPKALIEVKGQILIERQIEQLIEAGVPEVYIVTGYRKEQFDYLKKKYGVKIIDNPDYLTRNNNGSVWAAREVIRNTYICSADNYFVYNPFENKVEKSYYSAVYARGHTDEWCMEEDAQGSISAVTIGGENSWYMLGHAFWDEKFSRTFLDILDTEYHLLETSGKLWEEIFISHLDVLKMSIRKYRSDMIYEFDSLNELRNFDKSYWHDTRSVILKEVSRRLQVSEADISHIRACVNGKTEASGFEFVCSKGRYCYDYMTRKLDIAGGKSNG